MEKSKSYADVIRQLNLKVIGGTYTHIKHRIKQFGINTSHFLGKSSTKGRPLGVKKSWKDILVNRVEQYRRTSALYLRRALIEMGRPYNCEICGLEPQWNGKELRFEVDHVNGDWRDNRPENLKFCCPNCHSQMPTPSNKGYTGVTTNHQPKYFKTPKVTNHNWRRQPKLHCRKVERPSYEILINSVKLIGFRGTGKKFGVSDNSIRKWIRFYEGRLTEKGRIYVAVPELA